MVNALLVVSLVLFLHISSLRITPTTSSNLRVFELGTELLTTMTKLFQLSGNEHKIRRALTSSSKFNFTELNLLVSVLNSFKWSATDPPYDIFILNKFFIKNTLFEAESFS